MTSATSRGAGARPRAQIWKISAVLLLPILVLVGLAARASATLERPADATSATGR
jgi:hypothetical protein